MDFTRRGWLANLSKFLAAGVAVQVLGVKRVLALPEHAGQAEAPRRARKIWIGHY
jgi:hypothetical protein